MSEHGPLLESAWQLFLSSLRPPSTDVLYHYTSRDALLNILQSKRMWATDLRYMNDPEELTYSLGVIEEILMTTALRQRDGQRALWLALMRQQLRKVVNKSAFYSVSFCEEADLPQQWEEYGEQGSGYALGWSSDSRHPEVPLRIGVIYEPNQQKHLVDGMIDVHLTSFRDERDLTSGAGLERMLAAAGSLGVVFDVLVSNFKRPRWSREREYRYIYQALGGGAPAGTVLKRRRGGTIEKPYIETDFSKADLRVVIAGPRNDPVAIDWLRAALDSNGYSKTMAYRSGRG